MFHFENLLCFIFGGNWMKLLRLNENNLTTHPFSLLYVIFIFWTLLCTCLTMFMKPNISSCFARCLFSFFSHRKKLDCIEFVQATFVFMWTCEQMFVSIWQGCFEEGSGFENLLAWSLRGKSSWIIILEHRKQRKWMWLVWLRMLNHFVQERLDFSTYHWFVSIVYWFFLYLVSKIFQELTNVINIFSVTEQIYRK